MDRGLVHEEWERARREFHQLVEQADDAALRRPSNRARWNNRQLLFHMLLGYLILAGIAPAGADVRRQLTLDE
jgi:hypothetical protein